LGAGRQEPEEEPGAGDLVSGWHRAMAALGLWKKHHCRRLAAVIQKGTKMRQIVIDELRMEEKKKVEEFLRRHAKPGPMEGIFWLPVPPALWSEVQQGHADCAPYSLAIEVGEAAVSFELLVRTQATLHCACIGYATAAQRDYLLGFIDRMLAEQGIRA
jgi:hypothetical protein